jgi:hypothetical protein
VTHVRGAADCAVLDDAGRSLVCASSKDADAKATSPALSRDLLFSERL